MGLLNYLFGKKKNTKVRLKEEISGKCLELLSWSQYLDNIADSDHYISRKEYMAEIAQYLETMKFFISMDENDILTDYCAKHGFDSDRARDLYHKYEHVDEIMNQINDAYVALKLTEEKEYLDNILKVVDPAINLDEDQRKVVLLLVCDKEVKEV